MSTLMNEARVRVPRFAEAAVERARLTVVPQRALGRTQAGRTPFAVLVLGLLVVGVVGLLMFNTNMQQSSFRATALQQQVDQLTAKEQSLNMELDALRDPQHLAVEAKKLGMVAPEQPAFVRLRDGRILGNPTAAGADGAVRINPLPPPKPEQLAPKPIVIKVRANSPAATGDASTASGGAQGRTDTQTTDPESGPATGSSSQSSNPTSDLNRPRP